MSCLSTAPTRTFLTWSTGAGTGWPRIRSSTFRFVPGRAQESVREHEALLQLIESGADADTIEKAARQHRAATLDAYLAQAKQ